MITRSNTHLAAGIGNQNVRSSSLIPSKTTSQQQPCYHRLVLCYNCTSMPPPVLHPRSGSTWTSGHVNCKLQYRL